MQGILFLKDCDRALEAEKPENMSEDTWRILNKKLVTCIKMVVSDEILNLRNMGKVEGYI